MAGASKSGGIYENAVAKKLSHYKYNGSPIVVWGTAGSSKHSKDIESFMEDGGFEIETKTKGAWEFGSSKFQYVNGKYVVPAHTLFQAYLPKNYQPFNGFIPSFLKGDTSNATLQTERKQQQRLGNPLDYRMNIEDRGLASKYYALSGVKYIQVQGSGLYRTGTDGRKWGLPLLEMDTQIRIRCKPHKTNVSYSVQAQIVGSSKPVPSPYDLDDPKRLPPGFSV